MARSINDADRAPGAIDGQAGANFAKRLMQLETDRAYIGEEIKQVYREAKEAGFPAKHMRAYVRDCRKEPDELQSWRDYQAALEIALGPFMNTPLGEAAVAGAAAEAASRVIPLQRADIIGKRRRGRPRKIVQDSFPEDAA